jgi:hypothetical protein
MPHTLASVYQSPVRRPRTLTPSATRTSGAGFWRDSQDILSPGRDFNPRPSEQQAAVLSIGIWYKLGLGLMQKLAAVCHLDILYDYVSVRRYVESRR